MPPVMGRTHLASLLLALCLGFPGAANALEVQLADGRLRGAQDDRVLSFKGIPYAAPPVGELRWREPRPVTPWQGLRDATRYGDQCLQIPYPDGSPYEQAPAPMSEDCLTLNVWSPALQSPQALPVMVWLHGGNFSRGSGSLPIYDGSDLAARGVVVVTINYRLNIFGYLSHPLLSAEQGGTSGNYGLADQLAALRWVRDNIAAFGGDPGSVTLFGESAGSSAINQILAAPAGAGLLHRAIGQSGGALMRQPTLTDAHGTGRQLLPTGDLDVARALPAEMLLSLFARFEAEGGYLGPIVDGSLIPDQVLKLYNQGKFQRVPTLLGYNRDEATSFAHYPDVPGLYRTQTEFEDGLLSELGLAAWPLIWAYPEVPGSSQPYLDFWRDAVFGWNMQTWAALSENAGQPAWLYFFTYAPSNTWGRKLGAFHAAEIAYVFGNDVPNHPADRAVRDLVQTYWVNFARSGDPNGEGVPAWPRYGSEANYLELNPGPRALEDLSWLQIRLLDLLHSFSG